ncbi:MAG: hypothetical protein IPL49_02230 [Saprospirales bacterium]|nr:hypothetical protein [Saprospirales bacterium]
MLSPLLLLPLLAPAQTLQTLTLLPPILTESSGVEESGTNKIWTFNDGGGEAALYLCDTMGNLLNTIQIDEAWNRDWEDITQDDQNNFYIANTGNNSNSTTDLTIFKIPNPDTAPGISVTAEVISFAYEDQWSFPPPDDSLNFDCEAIWWDNGNLYLCTKNRTVPFDGKAYLYRLPDTPGQYVAEKIGVFDTGGTTMLNHWITAGDISPDGSKLTLLSSDKMWVFYDFTGDDFFGGKHIQVNFPSISQKEGICFVSETRLYITDEETVPGFGRNLYSIELPNLPTSGAEVPDPQSHFSLFPNPCRDWLAIDGNLIGYQLEIFDAKGSSLLILPSLTDPVKVPTGNLPNGLLFIRFLDKTTGQSWVEKVVKLGY